MTCLSPGVNEEACRAVKREAMRGGRQAERETTGAGGECGDWGAAARAQGQLRLLGPSGNTGPELPWLPVFLEKQGTGRPVQPANPEEAEGEAE